MKFEAGSSMLNKQVTNENVQYFSFKINIWKKEGF